MPEPHPLDDGTVTRLYDSGTRGWQVEVEWPDMDTTCLDSYPTDLLTCPDLKAVLTPDPGGNPDA
jgi:hypothetical protein